MGRELQKKKNRSAIQKVRHKPKSKKRHNPRGNAIIAANWDQSLTLAQNYRQLGLLSKLNGRSGGVEKSIAEAKEERDGKTAVRQDPLTLNKMATKILRPTEAKVEKDPKTGAILRIITMPSEQKLNPLRDPLNDLSDTDEEDDSIATEHGIGESTHIVKALEKQASTEVKPRPRQQSVREEEWIERLVNKYGENYLRMSRDRKLNPYQQTSSDIARRVKKWVARHGNVLQ